MLLDALICPNCGASLPAQAAPGGVVTCQYCSTTFRVPTTLTPEPDMGDLLLGADFSHTPITGWAFPNEDNIRLIPGATPEVRAKFAAAETLYYVLNSSGYFDNLDASVSIRFYEGELKYIDAGISLRYQKGVGSYAFLISPLGTYAVGYYMPGDDSGMAWKHIVDWTAHSAIHTGLDQVNRLRVTADAEHLRIYINGVLATSLHDSRYDAGEVLLDAEGGKNSSIEVGFTDLQLREIKRQ
jgi:hypothetical protein